MKNKKILFLLHLPPPVHGSSIVGQKIKNSELINNSFQASYINLLISRSVDESGKTKISKLIRFLTSWFQLLFKLIWERPDLCYFALTTTGNGFYKDVALIFVLKLCKTKTVFHLHNKGIGKNESKGMNSDLYRYVFNKSRVILLSNYLYDDVKSFVSRNQVYICSNGVENLITSDIAKLDKVINPIKILFLSNLIKSKGVLVLIEACRILQQKGSNFSCDFVGGEGDVSSHQLRIEIEKTGVAERVFYLGEKHGLDKDKAYRSADIFVLPTTNDCFPLVLLEAMQYELPIVTTSEGGIRDIVLDNVTGFIVDQNDPIDLANKLELLIENESMRIEMGRAGRSKYEKEFTLHAFESKLQTILEDILLKDIESKDK